MGKKIPSGCNLRQGIIVNSQYDCCHDEEYPTCCELKTITVPPVIHSPIFNINLSCHIHVWQFYLNS